MNVDVIIARVVMVLFIIVLLENSVLGYKIEDGNVTHQHITKEA